MFYLMFVFQKITQNEDDNENEMYQAKKKTMNEKNDEKMLQYDHTNLVA